MMKFAMMMAVPLALSACASAVFVTEELRLLKPVCTGGHWEVCAEIGHKVRQAKGENALRAEAQ